MQLWEPLRGLVEHGAAEACAHLESEGVPERVEARLLENPIDVNFQIIVLPTLGRRARWLTAECPLTDGELGQLAAGRLPSAD